MTPRRRRDPSKLSPEARQLIALSRATRRGVSRRGVLGGAGAAGAGLALSACGTGGSDNASSGSVPSLVSTIVEDISAEDPTVNWANWTAYIDFDDEGVTSPTLERFTSETGIAVNYDEAVEDNETFYSRIAPQLENRQDTGWDVVCLTDWMTSRMIRLGYCQELDDSNLPNKGSILDSLVGVDFDPGRVYSVPWQGGFAGIVWNKEAVPDGLNSVSDLWDPALRGRVVLLSEMRDSMGLLMLEQGVDIASQDWGDAEFESALAVLEEQLASGQVRQVRGNSYLDDLISGDALAAFGWSGDIAQINFEEGDQWEFALPPAGGTLWSDNLMVPLTSPRKTNAERLLNYYLDPEIAAEVAAWVNYISPIEGAREVIAAEDEELANDPYIFPTPEFLEQVSIFRSLTPDEETRYSSAFQQAIGN